MRCYNGQPDSQLQRILDDNAHIRAAIAARGFHVTYFPDGEFYMAFNSRHLAVTGECSTLAGVLHSLPQERS